MAKSKVLLVVLAVYGVSQSLAARVKLAEADSAAHARGKLVSLLGKRGYASKVLESLDQVVGRETPTDLQGILGALITELETTVETEIKTAFSSTQAELASGIDKLGTDTSVALAMKSTADAADIAWYNCVGSEMTSLSAQESAEDALSDATISAKTPCAEMESRGSTPFTSELTLGGWSCDVSQPGNCNDAFEQYNITVSGMISDMEADLRDEQTLYNNAKAECESAHALIANLTDALNVATQLTAAQKLECIGLHETRQTAMCSFGLQLQVKCGSVDTFRELVRQVQETTEIDLQAEWKTVSVVKCVLTEIVAGSEFDEATLSACENSVNYEGDVGTFDLFETTLENLTSAENLECGPDSVTFGGQTWDTPAGGGSASYSSIPYQPVFDVSNPAAPFDFCGGSVATAASLAECSFSPHGDGSPDGIVVEGAGTSSWNGCYARAVCPAAAGGTVCFSHQDDSGDSVRSIYDLNDVWRIAIPGDYTAYQAPEVSSSTPPTSGWVAGSDARTPEGMGDAPAPTLREVFV